MNKKRPEGQALIDWCKAWDLADHQEKLALCSRSGVTYEIGRHWRSDSGVETNEKPTMTVTPSELMATHPAVNLDFVMFDLETSGFDADWDIMLTACIKPYGQPTIVFRADDYPAWTENRANDKTIVVDVASELRKHAIVVGHYSQRFDVRFLRAKMLRHGVEPLPSMFGIDTWKIAKDNFKVSNRRMKSLSIFAQIPMEKEEPSGDRWMRAAFGGERKAMDAIVSHNVTDVELLEKLAAISFPYLRSIPRL